MTALPLPREPRPKDGPGLGFASSKRRERGEAASPGARPAPPAPARPLSRAVGGAWPASPPLSAARRPGPDRTRPGSYRYHYHYHYHPHPVPSPRLLPAAAPRALGPARPDPEGNSPARAAPGNGRGGLLVAMVTPHGSRCGTAEPLGVDLRRWEPPPPPPWAPPAPGPPPAAAPLQLLLRSLPDLLLCPLLLLRFLLPAHSAFCSLCLPPYARPAPATCAPHGRLPAPGLRHGARRRWAGDGAGEACGGSGTGLRRAQAAGL